MIRLRAGERTLEISARIERTKQELAAAREKSNSENEVRLLESHLADLMSQLEEKIWSRGDRNR